MEQELTGQAGLEADHGYVPMPEPPKEEKTFSSDAEGLREAAKELVESSDLSGAERPPQEAETVKERPYVYEGGNKTGERIPENNTIKIEKGAADLAQVRNDEAAAQQEELKRAIAEATDRLRNPEPEATLPPVPQQEAQQEVTPQEPAPQIEQEARADSGLSPKVAAALADPEIRAAIQKELEPVTQAQQQYAAAISQTLQLQAAAITTNFPELTNLNPQQIQGALAMLAQQNPQRHAAFMQQINHLKAVVGQANNIQQQQAADFKQRWNTFSNQEDAKFLQATPEMSDPQIAAKNGDLAVKTLRDVGFADNDIQRAWNGEASISLRDHRAQMLILDAAKYRALKAMPRPVVNVPEVMRPGVSQPRGAADDVRLSTLSSRLSQTGDPKDAAALLIARRAARR